MNEEELLAQVRHQKQLAALGQEMACEHERKLRELSGGKDTLVCSRCDTARPLTEINLECADDVCAEEVPVCEPCLLGELMLGCSGEEAL